MKILIIISLLAIPLKYQKSNDIFGKWKLERVEVNNEILTPTMDFFLTISKDKIGFNRDLNGCSSKPKITRTSIEFDYELCTQICCDGMHDPIGGMNLYQGDYIITENYLIIQNETTKTYLVRW